MGGPVRGVRHRPLAGTGTIGAYEHCFASRGKKAVGTVISWIPLLGSLGIAIGYAVILGWVLRSLGGAVTGTLMQTDSAVFFQQATGDLGSVGWHVAIVAIVCLILLFGVKGGIEKVSKVMMPLFFVLFLGLAIWVGFLPGAQAGYQFLFVPDWSALLRADTWVMAMGQAFFSLSITGSGMIVYGAYLGKNVDIPRASCAQPSSNTWPAMLSALAIMPAVFAFGVDVTSGPSLMFVTCRRCSSRCRWGGSLPFSSSCPWPLPASPRS